MPSVTQGDFNDDSDKTKNKIKPGANKFHVLGQFNLPVADTDVSFALGGVTGSISSVHVEHSSTTSIDGHFNFQKNGATRHNLTAFDDESGTVTATVQGATGPPTNVVFPPGTFEP